MASNAAAIVASWTSLLVLGLFFITLVSSNPMQQEEPSDLEDPSGKNYEFYSKK